MAASRAAWFALLLALSVLAPEFVSPAQEDSGPGATGWRTVTRVIDGDTLLLDRDEKVRLVGVDTPESVHPQKPVEQFGKEASAFTRRLAEGKQVRLEYDRGIGRRDDYGRTLAYVYLDDGRLLNLEIIEQGYGHAYVKYPFEKMEEFRAAERYARERGRGLWAAKANAERQLRGSERDLDAAGVTPGGSCIPRAQCCKVCSKGQACGNSCISASYTCRKGRGCACNAFELCR